MAKHVCCTNAARCRVNENASYKGRNVLPVRASLRCPLGIATQLSVGISTPVTTMGKGKGPGSQNGAERLQESPPYERPWQSECVSARSRLDGVAQTLELKFAQAVFPVRQITDLIEHYPHYDTIMAMWDNWVPKWWSWASESQPVVLMMVPQGVPQVACPLYVRFADQLAVLEHNTLLPSYTQPPASIGRVVCLYQCKHSNTNQETIMQIKSNQPPFFLASGVISAVHPRTQGNNAQMGINIFSEFYRAQTLVSLGTSRAMYFSNVTENTTWGIPHRPDCPPGLCYNNATQTKWWGVAAITLDVNTIFNPTGNLFILDQFSDIGLSWRLSSPTFGNTSKRSTVFQSTSADMNSHSMCRNISLLQDEWELCVWKSNWQPTYLVPLLVVLVFVALALSVATLAVLLSRHEHRALLHSLLPAKAIQRLQANFDWTSQSKAGKEPFWESGTPAELILGIMEDIVMGQMPALHKVITVRSTLQQSLDVYKPLEADLTQRMADTENMDSEVREALMVQLMGRQAKTEPEQSHGNMPDCSGWKSTLHSSQENIQLSPTHSNSHDDACFADQGGPAAPPTNCL
ncbi:calcium/calmodulin-dependent 3',5'-cyclic nucleotide phosphodiesterase 1B, partial [Haematococcus lacustris]